MLSSGKLKYVLAAAVMTLAIAAMQSPARAEFAAALVRCADVQQPNKLTGCGSDPLTRGSVRIDDAGHVEVAVVGAGANETYTIQFRSPNGGATLNADFSLNTNANGNGHVEKNKEFALNKAGTGVVVLSRSGATGDQYVSGFAIQHPSGSDFRGGLVKCGDVNVPAALGNCGTDPLKSGSFDLESDDGDLTISLRGASAGQTYTVVIRPATGLESVLGTVNTSAKGNGSLTQNPSTFTPTTIGSGTLVLERATLDQFVGGFKVTRKPPPPAPLKSGLVRCIDVTLPLLGACGTDPFDHGSVMIDQNGKITANLNGATPSTAYEVFFRPLDNSGDVDTGVPVTTDLNGDGHASGAFTAASGKIGSGSFVVKLGVVDEFVPGFQVK